MKGKIIIMKLTSYFFKYKEMNPLDPSMSLQRRCLSCGNKLFPYSSQDAEDWAVWCYYQCQKRNCSPSTLMYERAPNIDNTHAERPPKVIYY